MEKKNTRKKIAAGILLVALIVGAALIWQHTRPKEARLL